MTPGSREISCPLSITTVARPCTTTTVSSYVNAHRKRPGVHAQAPRTMRESADFERTVPLARGEPVSIQSAGSGQGSSVASLILTLGTVIAFIGCVDTLPPLVRPIIFELHSHQRR